MKLYPWQKAVTDYICNENSKGKTAVVLSPRQRGKSVMCEGILLWFAINHKNSTNAMLSPTLAQSRKVFKEIVNAISSSGIISKKNETLLEIELINGSLIFFKSAEMRDGLRGYSIKNFGVLILDEAYFLSSDILELVLPWIQVESAPLVLCSTPKSRQGIFYNYWLQGQDSNNNIKSFDWKDWDTSCMISEELVNQYRKVMTQAQFKSEICGEWIDDDGTVFTNINANAVAEPYNPDKQYSAFYVGIDFGAGGGEDADYTAITVFDNQGEMVYIDYFNDLSTFQQVERIITDLSQFNTKIRKIYMENNSIGSPFVDLIIKTANERKLNWLVNTTERFTTTNASKNKLVNLFTVGLERNEVKLLNDRTLLNQLSAYESQINLKTQTITYGGGYNTHDDLVQSSMMAWSAYKNNGDALYCIGNASLNRKRR